MKTDHNLFLGATSNIIDLDSCSISIVNYTKPVSENWHSHENVHLSLILQGGNLESRKGNDNQVLPGKIIAYNQGEVHRNRFTAFPSKNLNLEFEDDFFSKNDLYFNNLALNEGENLNAYLDLIRIYNELKINDSYTSPSIDLSIQSLFTNNIISNRKPNWLNQLKEIVEDRWNEFVSLDDLALQLNVHKVTISKYFKKYYNESLGDYMRKVKIRRALSYLFNTDASITEIAYLCGFSDHSHMIRVFKMYLGYNPKSIRKI